MGDAIGAVRKFAGEYFSKLLKTYTEHPTVFKI
jgi:hypothetical protein